MSKFYLLLYVMTIYSLAKGQDDLKKPCDGAEYRAFDFWLGEWAVYQDSVLAGSNNVVLLQDGCIVQENWKSDRGDYTGTSYNFYNPETQLWQQIWIDNQGKNIQLSGRRKENVMVLMSDTLVGKDSLKYVHEIRWTFISENHVNQNWQLWNSSDKQWRLLFNGDYRKYY